MSTEAIKIDSKEVYDELNKEVQFLCDNSNDVKRLNLLINSLLLADDKFKDAELLRKMKEQDDSIK